MIDRLKPDKPLSDHIYILSTSYIEQSYRFGVAKSFKGNEHYEKMSPNLKNKLVFAVLKQYYDEMIYFYFDFVENHTSDANMIRKMLTSLDCTLYEPGTTIIEAGKPIDNIYFVYQNKVNVLDKRQIFVLATLSKGSWFGDFNAFLNVNSTFTYVAHYEEDKNSDPDGIPRIMMLMCPIEKFLTLLQEYPKSYKWMM